MPTHLKGETMNLISCNNCGVVKEIRQNNNNSVFVVYNCNGDWDNFKNYTSTLTSLTDLKLGWKHK